jgi:prepilin-type N-terminal cleavage/methylation domain-containing protein
MIKRKAFTLVEALVVLMIIGIMVTIALPAFNRFYQMFKFRTAMNQVATDIRAARQAAITNARPVKITFLDLADYPEIKGMTGGYAVYMLDSTDLDDMDLLENWLEIAPARQPCGGKAEKPRFFAYPVVIDPAAANLLNVESDDTDGFLDLVFLADGSIYEGPYPRSDISGSADALLKFSDDTSKPEELSPGFTMETTQSTAVDRYAVYLSLFGKVSVFPYHS